MTNMTDSQTNPSAIRFVIPKGRMYDGVSKMLADAGIPIKSTSRNYRPTVPLDGFDVKVLKPQAIVEMLSLGSCDLGFAGADWVTESGAELVTLLDTGLDRVRLIAAAPESVLIDGKLPGRRIVVASEYANITRQWINTNELDAELLRSFGATEVLPPEDADCIVDNTATGSTLKANGLTIIDEIMTSSTRLYASKRAMEDPIKKPRIEHFVMLIQSVIEARQRVMIELNVSADKLDQVVKVLPCMRYPTISPMYNDGGYAVKSALLREELPSVILAVKSAGGTDIVVSNPEQIVP